MRNYDAQIGRWVQQDPFDEYASPYVGMGNDPVNQIDPSGGIAIPPCPGTGQLAIFFAKAGAKVGNIVSAISSISRLASISINVAKVGTEIFNKSVQTKIIDRQLVGNMTMQIGNEQSSPNYWILYNGTEVNIYKGKYGNTDDLIKSFKGSSGILLYNDAEGDKISDDYRNAKFQFTQREVNEGGVVQLIFVGPIPEGNYTIDLSLDPNRQAKIASNDETIPGKGIEKITIVRNGVEQARYPAWGSIRAKLDADPGTKLGRRDGNFYFHNSIKGYTHGCVETESEFFSYLLFIRKIQPTFIRVKIKYTSKNGSTNGHTKRH